jgi:hypothetical protein
MWLSDGAGRCCLSLGYCKHFAHTAMVRPESQASTGLGGQGLRCSPEVGHCRREGELS